MLQDTRTQRRSFLKYASAIVATGSTLVAGARAERTTSQPPRLRKALQYGMLPGKLSDAEKFKLARTCGYEGIEASPMGDLAAAKKRGDLAREAGTPIHSLVFGGWHAPFSDPDPDVRKKGQEGMISALRSAKAMGAGVVLLVPAIVREDVSYADAYKRSAEEIRKLLPVAEETQVIIAVENVWNKFLLSPLEFARYVDEFESPWLQAYFDVGNVIIYGFSQDWIWTLGKRIVRIHLKDFKRQGYQWKNLLEGDVNWQQVRRALGEVGYDGYLTPELGGGDQEYLTDLSKRIDKIIAMG